jgi:ribonuclease P protein component
MNADRNNGSGRHTLPRAKILRGKSHFDRLFREGNRLTASSVDLRYTALPDATAGCLVAFVAGRKVGNAVVRNRCKRRMREAYRQYPLQADATRGLHLILIAKKPDVPYAQVETDIRSLIDRLQVQLTP